MDGLSPPTLHAVLRDRLAWRGEQRGLVADATGALRLAAAPGPGDGVPIMLPGPFDVPASGIAGAPCGDVALADGAAHRIVLETDCGDRALLGQDGTGPGGFRAVTALAFAADRLFAADPVLARVQGFGLPALGLAALWEGRFGQPEALAADAEGRLLLLDRAARRLRRFAADGSEDTGFASHAAVVGALQDPRFVTAAALGWTLVADAGREAVLAFDASGVPLGPLAPPAPGWRPRALLAVGERLYVADAASGRIWLMDGPSGAWLGMLRDWQGPVAGLAATTAGDLLVKPGPEPRYHRLTGAAGCVAAGRLEAGPLDAGIENGWHVLRVEAETPAGTRVTASVALTADAATPPAPTEWRDLAGPVALLEVVGRDAAALGARRFLWLRLELASGLPGISPRLHQVAAATQGERLLDYLPAIYARADGAWADPPEAGTPRGFLRRLLDLLQQGTAEAEGLIDLFPQRLDPGFAPPGELRWLAEWLALELPARLDASDRRALLSRAVALHARGGTPAHLRAVVALHTGLAVQVDEAFRQRAIWLLDHGRGLGFDTALPLVDPEGLVLEGEGRAEPGVMGRPLIGAAALGATSPIAETEVFTPLFAPTAHRFVVRLPPMREADAAVAQVRAVIEREAPAHTAAIVCATPAALRVGVSARVGRNAVVAAGPSAGRVETAKLGRDARLAVGHDLPPGEPAPEARLGSGASIVGQGLRVG
jgi:phage tail-like protein